MQVGKPLCPRHSVLSVYTLGVFGLSSKLGSKSVTTIEPEMRRLPNLVYTGLFAQELLYSAGSIQ